MYVCMYISQYMVLTQPHSSYVESRTDRLEPVDGRVAAAST